MRGAVTGPQNGGDLVQSADSRGAVTGLSVFCRDSTGCRHTLSSAVYFLSYRHRDLSQTAHFVKLRLPHFYTAGLQTHHLSKCCVHRKNCFLVFRKIIACVGVGLLMSCHVSPVSCKIVYSGFRQIGVSWSICLERLPCIVDTVGCLVSRKKQCAFSLRMTTSVKGNPQTCLNVGFGTKWVHWCVILQ